jgi:hypothetical protein
MGMCVKLRAICAALVGAVGTFGKSSRSSANGGSSCRGGGGGVLRDGKREQSSVYRSEKRGNVFGRRQRLVLRLGSLRWRWQQRFR